MLQYSALSLVRRFFKQKKIKGKKSAKCLFCISVLAFGKRQLMVVVW